MPTPSTRRRLIDGVTMFVVTGLSLLLLAYVGYGEGKRTYEQYEIEKLTAQGRIIQNAIESYLRAGLPLHQYAGFNTLAEPIVEIEEIDAIGVYDQSGRQLFQVIDKSHPKLPEPSPAIGQSVHDVVLDDGGTHYQIVLPLRTRFETVGSVLVVSNKAYLTNHLHASFRPLLSLVAGLAALFALLVALAGPHLVRSRWPWLQIGYAMTFLILSGALVGTLVNLYSDGAQSRAKAAAFTLSQRLGDVIDFNLRFRDFDGLDRMFGEYRRVNPEISEAALVIDGVILIDTDPAKQGRAWVSNPRDYEFSAGLSRPEQTRQVSVAVSVPARAVYERVEHSVRNFVALFIASGFLAGLFLQVAVSMQRLSASAGESPISRGGIGGEWALTVVKPIFFLAVFLDSLTYSFLPKFMQEAAVGSGLSLGFASAPFTAYYLCFALSLIPAGHFAERHGPKLLIWVSLIVAGASLACLGLPLGIGALTVLRGVSGAAQGTLFIGIQAYILAVASPEKKTQGAAIIVFGFQGGMISGMAIGSLLVNFLHPQGVFALSAVIGFATAAYSVLLIPRQAARGPSRQGLGAAIRRVTGDLARVVQSGDFLRTMFCIGVPAKAVLTGVITFALPLLLGQQGYRQEEIGQVIMLYGIGVVAASSYASRLVDRTGKTDVVLFWGAAVSGFGLVLIGLMGASGLGGEWLGTALVVAGVLVVGTAHGLINAPVVTHVAHSQLAQEIGANPVTTTYRFLERIGHVAGPFLVGQFFLIWGQSAQIVAWIGVAIGSLGFVFIIHHARPRISAMGSKAAS